MDAPAISNQATTTLDAPSGIEVFTFGEPEAVLDKSDIIDYFQSWNAGKWYEPPVSMEGLSKSFRSSPHHSSAIFVKCNILSSTYKPHPWLSQQDFKALAMDYMILGNGYLENRINRLGKTIRLVPSLAKYTRRGIDPKQYSILHLKEPDINQEIYGLPQYLAALNSAWLNESATLFRRRYYRNGSHAGYIMYITDPAHDSSDIDALRAAVKSSKGPGNFRNLFMYAPNGKKDGIQVIPLSEVAAKDEFFNIKNVTRDDILAAHRVPPQLMGIVPNVTGGFGSVTDAAKVFNTNEIKPLQTVFRQLNDWLGEEVISFNDYDLAVPHAETGPSLR
jgi:capsid portal protein